LNSLDKISQELPRTGGGYAIIIRIEKNIKIELFKKNIDVKPGFYVYIGSACGPGGLRARILRHLKRTKKIRWHIDKITSNINAKVIIIIYSDKVQGNSFERKVSSCLFRKGLDYIEKFGSTDDKENISHLFYSKYLDKLSLLLKECIMEITNNYIELIIA